MNIRIALIVCFTLCICIGVYTAFNSKQEPTQNTLVVGTAAGYAPWVSINEKGIYEGFDIDVAQELAQTLNKKLILKDLGSMSALFMALEQGSIDIIMWGLSITSDRLKKIAMVYYQGDTITTYPLLFFKQIPQGIKTIEDMKGLTVCVEPGSSQAVVLDQYPCINQKLTERIDDALLNIQYGKADAAFVEPAIAQKFQNKYPTIVSLAVPLAPENHVQGVGIVIKKENTKLIEQIERAVDELIQKNIIKTLETKWNIS